MKSMILVYQMKCHVACNFLCKMCEHVLYIRFIKLRSVWHRFSMCTNNWVHACFGETLAKGTMYWNLSHLTTRNGCCLVFSNHLVDANCLAIGPGDQRLISSLLCILWYLCIHVHLWYGCTDKLHLGFRSQNYRIPECNNGIRFGWANCTCRSIKILLIQLYFILWICKNMRFEEWQRI